MNTPVDFYDKRRIETYAHELKNNAPAQHGWYQRLKEFIAQYGLQNKRCLEVGSGRGLFQDMVEDYTGTDIAESLSSYYHKPYKVANGSKYNFEDESFDVIWSVAVFEHIPEIQEAMCEIKRLLRGGDTFILHRRGSAGPGQRTVILFGLTSTLIGKASS
jgi:SAM-dependent methyltransferase